MLERKEVKLDMQQYSIAFFLSYIHCLHSDPDPEMNILNENVSRIWAGLKTRFMNPRDHEESEFMIMTAVEKVLCFHFILDNQSKLEIPLFTSPFCLLV